MNRRTFLKKSGQAGCLFGTGAFSLVTNSCRRSYDLDLVLKGGQILDGSGKASFPADVGVKNQRIAAVGNLPNPNARRILSIEGLTLAPGFIDVHSHSEDELLVNPRAESKIRQGVTTEILGQDGGSIAPLTEEMRERRSLRYQERYGFGVDWRDFDGYFARLLQSGTAVNVASMLGQGTLRQHVLGSSDRKANATDVGQMQELAQAALEQGALGISSGLEYTPGAFASAEEITGLCKVMKGAAGLYATHMRNEDDEVLEAVAEAIAIARDSGVGLHISHIKSMGQRNWHKLDDIFARIEAAQSQGVSVTMDRYPYVAYSTSLSSVVPIWTREGGTDKFLARLQDLELLPRIKSEVQEKVEMIGSWASVMISSVGLEQNRALQGRTVAEIASEKKIDPFDLVTTLLIEERNRVGMCGFAMSEENVGKLFRRPDCMVASDGSALAPYGPLSLSKPHPRSYGTFPRVLSKYVREEKVLSLPETVRKITSLPAARFGIRNRGQIKQGYMADLVVFDPATVVDQATFAEPHQYPIGIEYVLVNGEVVIENGEHSGQLPGTVLRGRVTE